MCKEHNFSGLPRVPPPIYAYDCQVFSLGKLPQFKKGKTVMMGHLKSSELLHMDLAFWNTVSRRGFSTVLTLIDACSRFIWIFCTARNNPPIHILCWYIMNLRREDHTLARIRFDEDGALAGFTVLAGSTVRTSFICDEAHLNLKTTGGYDAFLNGKFEHPNRALPNAPDACC
jgi:hypothetical protein